MLIVVGPDQPRPIVAVTEGRSDKRIHFALGNIWIKKDTSLHPTWLNEVSTKTDFGIMLPEWHETDLWFPKPFEETLHPALPLAIDPLHVARRLTVQRSQFTIHGTDKDGLDNLATTSDSGLVKFTVSADDIVQILDDLSTCGIAETTVFPDLKTSVYIA